MKEGCNNNKINLIALLASVMILFLNVVSGFNLNVIDNKNTPLLSAGLRRGNKDVVKSSNFNAKLFALSIKEQEQAAAMSEYLVRSHEAKLKAVQELETSKQIEITTLHQQINQLKDDLQHQQQQPAIPLPSTTAAAPIAAKKASSPPAAGKDLSSLSKEELILQVLSYQNFMAEYLIDAQVQKVNFMKQVEQEVTKKYEDKLASSSSSSPTTTPPSATVTPAAVVPESSSSSSPSSSSAEKKLYQERNAEMAKASEAGKSRWGDMEVKRVADAKKQEEKTPVVETNTVGNKISAQKRNGVKKVPAAGGVVQTLHNGTKKPEDTITANTNVVVNIGASIVNGAAAAAPATEIPVPPEVEAADHGMRADGGVGGLSLAERVAQGANAPVNNGNDNDGKEEEEDMNGGPSEMELIFRQRNKLIADAGKAGKSRWGNLEVGKADECATKHFTKLSSETTKAETTTTIQTLTPATTTAERVNLGAQILGKK